MAIVFLQSELLSKASISLNELLEWEKAKLLKPDGYTEDKIAYYSEHTLQESIHIKKIIDLGYSLEEIKKIIKKVGLPKESGKSANKKNNQKFITVGELADKIGVSSRTIKHWEDKGIIDSDMRSEGGFRLYSEIYVYLCSLILDLQNFGYSLDEIKVASDLFREFWAISNNMELLTKEKVSEELDSMNEEVNNLSSKINILKTGIERWEELLKKKKKEIQNLKIKNNKRS